MKFLMKLALAGITPSGTVPHPHSSPIAKLLSDYLRIARNRYHHVFYDRITLPIEKRARKQKDKWMPIVKATTQIENSSARHTLKGRSILCVGGQEKHYPVYHELVKAAGGHLVTFYGDSNDSIKQLQKLLEKVDMVICPIDCVNHEAYFTVKRYCQYSGKHCALLDRSQTGVFKKGIEKLMAMTAKQVECTY